MLHKEIYWPRNENHAAVVDNRYNNEVIYHHCICLCLYALRKRLDYGVDSTSWYLITGHCS